MSVNVSFVPQTAATRALIAFELKSTAKTNNKVQNVKCGSAEHGVRRSYYAVQSSPGPQSASEFDQTVNWTNQSTNQPSYPATPKSPLPPLFAFGSSITMRVRYSIHTHTQTERDTDTEAQWGKQTIAHCDCHCPMQMKLCSAALMCRIPLPRALPHDPSPLEYAIKSHTEDTTATGATLSEPMWQTDLVTIIYSYVPGCLSRPEQSHLGPTNPLPPWLQHYCAFWLQSSTRKLKPTI